MTVDPDGFARLAAAFLATRENPNTRAAYARDLTALAEALDASAPDADVSRVFGIEDDPGAREAATQLAALPLEWW